MRPPGIFPLLLNDIMDKRLLCFGFAVVVCFGYGCRKTALSPAPSISRFEEPTYNSYSISELGHSAKFEALVLDKNISAFKEDQLGKSNFVFIVFLRKAEGTEISVSGMHTPESTLRAVSALKEGQRYTFPDVLLQPSNNP